MKVHVTEAPEVAEASIDPESLNSPENDSALPKRRPKSRPTTPDGDDVSPKAPPRSKYTTSAQSFFNAMKFARPPGIAMSSVAVLPIEISGVVGIIVCEYAGKEKAAKMTANGRYFTV